MAMNQYAFGELPYDVMFSPSQLLEDEITLESNMTFGQPVLDLQVDAIIEAQQVAPPPQGPPDRTPIVNACDFRVEINSTDTNKSKYLFSSQLNRIYVDMNSDFAVQFSWVAHEGPLRPFVRATVVFTDEAQAEKRVERCVQHRHENSDLSETIRMHVLRSSREVGTRGVHYQGSLAPDSWFSVVVELGPPPASHAYRFVCKNSCSSGINRRPISVVYTLEDCLGKIYGRAITSARVCSCPRRDLLRDQTADGLKGIAVPKRGANGTPKPSKKIKLEVVPAGQPRNVDTHLLMLPQLQVVGSNVLTTGLEVMVRMMEQGMAARFHDAQYVAQCTACIQALNATIQQHRPPPQ